jgi:hypothetical protein
MDAELLYHALRELAESHGFVTDHADELLADAARSIAEYESETVVR